MKNSRSNSMMKEIKINVYSNEDCTYQQVPLEEKINLDKFL